ncbi:MAG: hypothetical protein H7Z42_12225 [Roseiflexaceae bacterium]|nr:hypothetical protein [Roseiflexaceae bacterium]
MSTIGSDGGTMQLIIVMLTLAMYGLAAYLWRRDGVANYVIALAAGQLGTLLAPLWQTLYSFEYAVSLAPLFRVFGQDLPRTVIFGGWQAVLPAPVIF